MEKTTVFQQENHNGFCPICEKEVAFSIKANWLRDNYICTECKSIPRQRAIINTLNIFVPEFDEKIIHESSPSGPTLRYFKNKCKDYTFSHFFSSSNLGDFVDGVRNENLEEMTFESNSLDVFITQDVFEHVLNPDIAFKEINRVLKPGGIHIFTVPWYKKMEKTRRRAQLVDGEIVHHLEPDYHGNPIDKKGSLVTFDYGNDLPYLINKWSEDGYVTVYLQEDRKMGLEAEFLEIFIYQKNM